MPTEPTTPHEATRKGVADAWDFWFSQHPVSVPELIHEAVTASVREWLDRHGSSLLATPGAPPAEPAEARCPSCDHLTEGHTAAGCWYVIDDHSPRVDGICPCTRVHKPATTPEES